jgi:1,4-alpha-glucan branching enzyme
VDDPTLRYRDLAAFDRELQALDEKFNLLAETPIEQLHVNEDHKVLVCRRGPLIFAFNFHPTRSSADYRFGVPGTTDYRLVLNTDDFWFGGHGLVDVGQVYPLQRFPADHRNQSVQVYIPARSAQVLTPHREQPS